MGAVIQVTLSKGKVALIDAESLPLVASYNWHAKRSRHGWYAQHKRKQSFLMHRLILSASKGIYVDHKNGNGLDNRRENLRLCTNAQNAQNKRIRNRRNTSGIHGVFWEKSCNRWRVQICTNYKKVHVGVFKTKEAAEEAYKKSSLIYHGEFSSAVNSEGRVAI